MRILKLLLLPLLVSFAASARPADLDQFMSLGNFDIVARSGRTIEYRISKMERMVSLLSLSATGGVIYRIEIRDEKVTAYTKRGISDYIYALVNQSEPWPNQLSARIENAGRNEIVFHIGPPSQGASVALLGLESGEISGVRLQQ